MTDTPRCSAPTKTGKPCPHRCAAGAALCTLHQRAAKVTSRQRAEWGRKGGRARAERARRERDATVATLRIGTIEQLRAVLEKALHMAASASDHTAMIRAVQVGADLLTSHGLEREVESMRVQLEQLTQRMGAGAMH